MHRIQIQLTDEQEQMLRDLARLRNASILALVREGLDLLLELERARNAERLELGRSIVGMIGANRERATDISARHDVYLRCI